MEFNRIGESFFEPANNTGYIRVFLYKKKDNRSMIIFDNIFIEKELNWAIIFIKGLGNLIDLDIEKLDRPFSESHPTGYFLWLDNYKAFNYDKRRYIEINKSKVTEFYRISPVYNQGNNSIYQFWVYDLEKTKIFIDSDRIKFINSIKLSFEINKGIINPNLFEIDIKPTSVNFGSFNIQSLFKKDSFLPIKIPIISSRSLNGGEEPVITYDLFPTETYDGAKFTGTYFPFEDLLNDKDQYLSKFSIRKAIIETNFCDSRGNRFLYNGNNDDNLAFYFARINIDKTDDGSDRHVLRPLGKMRLVLNNATHLLLGYSGTESINTDDGKVSISFTDDYTIFVNEKEGSFTSYNKNTKTSLVTFFRNDYNLDSERKPLFSNTNLADYPVDLNIKEVAYAPIKVSSVSENIATPVIPTLAFGNPLLLEIEKIFSKIRLEKHTKKGNPSAPLSSFITPQGFLRRGNFLDFIQEGNIGRDIKTTECKFCVDGVTITSDFYLSLCREDVFFIVTPKMIKNQSVVSITVNFKICDFKVELKEFNTPGDFPNPKNDTYIIFKFSRHSLTTLLNDPTKWSNYGSYELAADDAQELIEDVNAKINFPEGTDYEYFNKTIAKDNNWNGVVIINVPLGDRRNLPRIFDGLAGSQDLTAYPMPPGSNDGDILKLTTGLKFQYVAFPVNKTAIRANGLFGIDSTSFYGIVDYDLLNKNEPGNPPTDDYKRVSSHFPAKKENIQFYRFVLSKLLVRFENSSIQKFSSFSFLQIPELFDNKVDFGTLSLSHERMPPGDEKANLIRLEGQYQKNSAGEDEFNFNAQPGLKIDFEDGNLLESIDVSSLGFVYLSGTNEYRFEIDAKANFKKIGLDDLLSFDELKFQNIGLKFSPNGFKLPNLHFDLSKLIVLPKINFDGKGFLKSFPVKFSHFANFKFPKVKLPSGEFKLDGPDFDFSGMKINLPNVDLDWLQDPANKFANLFSFIFDIDLGSLGNLELLKSLKGQFCIGWSFNGGFALGFKFAGASQGLHVDFGALKLDIKEVNVCSFEHDGSKSYFLRLLKARFTVFGKELPDPNEFDFNGIIYANPFGTNKSSKLAWFIAATKGNESPNKEKLVLGFGQRVGLEVNTVTSVKEGIDRIKEIFQTNIAKCDNSSSAEPVKRFYRPDRNILMGTEDIIPSDYGVTFKALFNDPVLYGARFGINSTGFELEILYKRISENLGVYSVEIQLPDAIRSYDTGAAYFRLPNIGIDVFTNGDWKFDIGFPKGDDWSRSGFLQLRTVPPFVGWFGFYIMQSKVASLTLFKNYIEDSYSINNLNIVQAGFAMRVGLGAYIDGGVFYIGASITVYGILEGAFAFKKGNGLARFFPNHFAVLGRVGAIAEVVVYVDFFIIQARADFRLQVEFGMLLIYLSEPGSVINPTRPGQQSGIQPIKLYIEGRVVIRLSVKIGCIKFHLSFEKTIRFEYCIGGGGNSSLLQFDKAALPGKLNQQMQNIDIVIKKITDVPMVYLPGYSKVKEDGAENLLMIHNFFIPFFGKAGPGDLTFTDQNIVKTKIIKPFFEDLISQLKEKGVPEADSYNTLRSILLNVADFGYKANISLPNYTSTFVTGINSETKEEIKKILIKHFLFNEEDIAPCDTLDTCQPIVKIYKDSSRILQAPVSTKIKIVDKDNNTLFTSETGFKINIEGLVNNEAGTSSAISSDISAIFKDEEDMKNMATFYDDYKTQFIARNEDNLTKKTGATPKDIRKTVIIPEFFKLFALLTLESFYDAVNPKDKKGEKINPVIKIDAAGLFNYTFIIKDENGIDKPIAGTWNPNDAFENGSAKTNSIAEQLNYFYNSGLRIPENSTSTTTTSLYEILNQREKITPITDGDWKKVKICINDFDITNDVFGATESSREANIAGTQGMWAYIDGFSDSDFLPKLKMEFNPSGFSFVKPFELIPVTLAVQTGRLDIGDPVQSKFFELPKKLAQHAKPGTKFSFAVNYANSQKQEEGKDVIEYSTLDNVGQFGAKLDTVACLNLEIKVKKRAERIVEISNVLVDDLNLAFAIRNILSEGSTLVTKLNFYYKPEEADPKKNIALTSLVNTRATILKTNLSPRTTPPVISEKRNFRRKEFAKGERKYIADSDGSNKANFANLLWEALTTNNGGYSLVVDKDLPNLGNTEQTIIISFETELSESGIPKCFNTLKLNNKLEYQEVFKTGLNDKVHYLFIDHVNLGGKEVREFHPMIAAHTFSFQVLRDPSKNPSPNTSHYLPLEFNLKDKNGVEILDRDKVLAIMPTSQDADNDILRYKHISPLVTKNSHPDSQKENDVNNIYTRYLAVGNEYSLDYSLRDTYGFRTSGKDDIPINSRNYQHYYFDKLVPIESWPFIKSSHWLNDQSNENKLIFDLRFSYSLLEILDAAGIERITGGAYKYTFEEEISKDDRDKIFYGLRNSLVILSTISAQLYDERSEVEISYWHDTATRRAKNELFTITLQMMDILQKMVEPVGGKYYMPKDMAPIIFQLELNPQKSIKQELNFFAKIRRLPLFTLNSANAGTQFDYDPAELNDDSLVWDFNSTCHLTSRIMPVNPFATANSTDADLNDIIRKKTANNYSIGISSNEETKEKITYIINEGKLSDIAVSKSNLNGDAFNQDKCYFGIKPFSNKLWSGNYEFKPEIGPVQLETFSNMDLDKSLRIVLAKIDELLRPDMITPDLNNPGSPVNQDELKNLYEYMVAAKKFIVESQLMDKADWVMMSPTERIDEIKTNLVKKMKGRYTRNGIKQFEAEGLAENMYIDVKDTFFSSGIMTHEFRSLLLAALTNFYSYDGIIRSSLTGLEILNADPDNKHRLTVSLKYDDLLDPQNKNYNLYSSKLGYENEVEWNIFFDQKETIEGDVSFSVQPEITHIEFDIDEVTDEIEHSTWIQLITPVQLKDKTGKYKVENWKKITRNFPERPIITKHEAIQQYSDLNEWKIQEIGKWYYNLQLNDPYEPGDILYAELILETPLSRDLAVDTKDFRAFIAFWSSRITTAVKDEHAFKWEEFAKDLSKQFSEGRPSGKISKFTDPPYFELNKVDNKAWLVNRISDSLKPHLKLNENGLGLKIENLDIFSSDATVYSVSPEIKVLRNKGVNNPDFWYETETVTPVGPVVPHIKYFKPLQLQNSTLAFETLVFAKLNTLAFKAMGKYLVNTDHDFPSDNHTALPTIPIRLIECKVFDSSQTSTDILFKDYQNGYPAFSLTVYNNKLVTDADLPIFHAETIVKK